MLRDVLPKRSNVFYSIRRCLHSPPSRPNAIPRSSRYLATNRGSPPSRPRSYPASPNRASRLPESKDSLRDNLIAGVDNRVDVKVYPYLFLTWRLFQLGVTFFLITHYVGNLRTVGGPSMLPALDVSGDWVLVSWLHARGKGIQIGDMVSYEHPMHRGVRAIKRVIAMEGDFVLRDTPGGLEGQLEDVEGWAREPNEEEHMRKRDQMMIKVPKGHCWVVGDNLSWSRDSRMFGPLPLALIKGKVMAIKEPGLPWSGWRAADGRQSEANRAIQKLKLS